ncbi:hypothetical protein CIT31_24925 [Mesorhizobium wenxiniae]|uniref:Uncharacterized protein n=1 Tax=Mesorhizobium wenxiniae TaxID=2014805 RepID=A0A271KAP0_9HYPH|nr:hypothetical protein CIT31_24925 [Mesorhizobium wenxiniae]
MVRLGSGFKQLNRSAHSHGFNGGRRKPGACFDLVLPSIRAIDRTAELETDSGTIELAMNRILAERLLSAVVEFLQAGEGDDASTFAVERFAVGVQSA